MTKQFLSTHTQFGNTLITYSNQSITGLTFIDYEDFPEELKWNNLITNPQAQPFIREVVDQLNTQCQFNNIPIEFTNGTKFQRLVWNALTLIPRGETRTYSDIATQIGHPKAVRAVGTACRKNPIAIIVPCHRVVPSNSKLGIGNYRWGKEIKEKLLQMEKI